MKRYVLICAMIVIASFGVGAFASRFFTVGPVVKAQSEIAREKWEYCAVSRASFTNAARSGVYWISYFRESGVQVVEVEDAPTERNGMTKTIAKLGAEGWEMIGPAPLDVRQNTQINAIYFKRRK